MDFLDDHTTPVGLVGIRPKLNREGERRLTLRFRLGIDSKMPGLTEPVMDAAQVMERDLSLSSVTISETIPSRNLSVKDTTASRQVRQKFAAVELMNFEVERFLEDGKPSHLMLTFETTVRWEEVDFAWLKDAYGATVALTISEAQQELPTEPRMRRGKAAAAHDSSVQ